MSMEVVTSIAAMQGIARRLTRTGSVGLVPTMGALHQGHLSLVRAARERCDAVVVSIFVNPTQFGPNEDFARYPRTLESDLKMLEGEGVAVIFAPSADEMYPNGGAGTFIEVPGISERLDGAFRLGHFRGVATVVAKLFHMVSPDMAFFGQKDAAQVAVLRAMVRDLNFPIELVVCPIVREPDGLALSSRNRYPSDCERAQALVLQRALRAAEEKLTDGQHCARALRETMLKELEREPSAKVEYADVVDPDTLLPIDDVYHPALLAIAAHVGQTRLIDNLLAPDPTVRLCE